MGPLQRVAQLPPRWQKLPNAKCKVPTELLLSLNTSERGCSSIRFSHNGYFLACAEVNKLQENNLISIFEVNLFIKIDFFCSKDSFLKIPRGQRVAVFTGHLQMIYDLDWSRTDRYLASASADSSVK
jgi:jouberin